MTTSRAGRLGCVVTLIAEVRLMHDPGHLPENRVLQQVVLQERLEAAVSLVVGELCSEHVEGCGAVGYVRWILDEDELGLEVDEALDEPGARGPVDVAAGSGCPLHVRTCTDVTSSSTARVASSLSRGGK